MTKILPDIDEYMEAYKADKIRERYERKTKDMERLAQKFVREMKN